MQLSLESDTPTRFAIDNLNYSSLLGYGSEMFRFISLIAMLTLLLQAASCFATPAQASKTVIAHVGIITSNDAKAYSSPDLASLPEMSFRKGEKVVVLQTTSRFVEILLADGDEAYLSPAHVVNRDPVTLSGALGKIEYFEKMAIGTPEHEKAYFDAQSAPWVALVARYLSNQEGAGTLPPLSTESAPGRSTPQLNVVNDTKYTLRIYMAGVRTVSRRIAPGATFSDDFPAGNYKVVVESTTGSVIPLRTTWVFKSGYTHTITLTIVRR